MAWRSGGNSNDEMCDQLHRNGIINKGDVLEAFRQVSRGFFVPSAAAGAAFEDAPLRCGAVHMSAPHIYGAVADALDMGPGLSFLNVGSGTGYLSTVMAVLGGATSLNHGIEVNAELHAFAQSRTQAFKQQRQQELEQQREEEGEAAAAAARGHGIAEVELICGNVFDCEELGATRPPQPLARGVGTSSGSSGSSGGSSAMVESSPVSVAAAELAALPPLLALGDATPRQAPPSSLSSSSSSSSSPSSSLPTPPPPAPKAPQPSSSSSSSVALAVYDRVYVGAACDTGLKTRLLACLALGGVLVAPVGDELLKVRRIDVGDDAESFDTTVLSGVRFVGLCPSTRTPHGSHHHHGNHYPAATATAAAAAAAATTAAAAAAARGTLPRLTSDTAAAAPFTFRPRGRTQAAAAAAAAPLPGPLLPGPRPTAAGDPGAVAATALGADSEMPLASPRLPRTLWSPETHAVFPATFKRSCLAVLTAARRASGGSGGEGGGGGGGGGLAPLPNALWLEILSFTNRRWFEPAPSEADRLRLRLAVEREAKLEAQQVAREAKRSRYAAERECSRWRAMAGHLEERLRLAQAAAAAPAAAAPQRRGGDGGGGRGIEEGHLPAAEAAAAAERPGAGGRVGRLGTQRGLARFFMTRAGLFGLGGGGLRHHRHHRGRAGEGGAFQSDEDEEDEVAEDEEEEDEEEEEEEDGGEEAMDEAAEGGDDVEEEEEDEDGPMARPPVAALGDAHSDIEDEDDEEMTPVTQEQVLVGEVL